MNKEFTIDRATWLRGKGSDASRLIATEPDGKNVMCCLGFYAVSCGLTQEQIKGCRSPSDVAVINIEGWNDLLLDANYHSLDNMLANDLMRTNDNRCITDEERERIIIEDFARHGITVKFVG